MIYAQTDLYAISDELYFLWSLTQLFLDFVDTILTLVLLEICFSPVAWLMDSSQSVICMQPLNQSATARERMNKSAVLSVQLIQSVVCKV